MYSLARDWVKPKYYRPPPSKMNKSALPPPSVKWENFNNRGEYVSPLTPQSNLLPLQDDSLTTREALLTEHRKRWKQVSNNWKKQSKRE